MKSMGVVVWGMGKMGRTIAQLVLEKQCLKLKGAIDCDPKLIGKDIGDVLGTARVGVAISSDAEEVLARCTPDDVAVIATGSHVPQVFPLIKEAVSRKLNVISTAEEMAYPGAQYPELAAQIDEMAKEKGVRVMGTGVNPGFILDLLVITLTGACHRVRKVKARRTIDLSVYGASVMSAMGIGLEPDEFRHRVRQKTVVGHVGFHESVALIAKALSMKIDRIEETLNPIVAVVGRSTDVVEIKAGHVAGCDHSFRAYSEGRLVIELIHPITVMPHLEGLETSDEIEIDADPGISLKIKPAIEGKHATTAMVVNMIPLLRHAPSGLVSMLDAPIPRCCS